MNPNYGSTNFDNLLYSLVALFQSVTLEGWSVIMIMVNHTYTAYAFVFFVPLVFIGAFFLLNLTLAVINSAFTSAHENSNKISGPQAKKVKGVFNLEALTDREIKEFNEE